MGENLKGTLYFYYSQNDTSRTFYRVFYLKIYYHSDVIAAMVIMYNSYDLIQRVNIKQLIFLDFNLVNIIIIIYINLVRIIQI